MTAAPQPFLASCLLDILDEKTLEHLVTGFREKLRTGVALICCNQNGGLAKIQVAGEGRFWSALCTCFREDCGGTEKCCAFDAQIALKEFGIPCSKARSYQCEPLGLTDIVAPIVVQGRTLGVVLAGQRLPRDRSQGTVVLASIISRYPQFATQLSQAFEEDYRRDGSRAHQDPNEFTSLATKQEIDSLVLDVAAFADVIADICQRIVELSIQLRQREFVDFWLKELSDARPDSATTWQNRLQRCMVSMLAFVGRPIERVGLLAGSRDKKGPIKLGLAAMNSQYWWQSEPIILETMVDSEIYLPGELPTEIIPAVGADLARAKCFLAFGYEHRAAFDSGNVYTLILIQAATEPDYAVTSFCRLYCDLLARRDAITRLFLWQRAVYEEFETHVVDIRHDLNTAVQHIVGQSEELVRWVRSESRKIGARCETAPAGLRKSVEEHATLIARLRAPGSATLSVVESLDIFEFLRGEVELYQVVAQSQKVRITVSALPSKPAFVACERADLARGFGSLIENAIKFSFQDRNINVTWSIVEGKAMITIENYGIGIPPEKLANMKQRNLRGEVKDLRFERPGTGRGVVIASQVFEDILGGKLEYKSWRPPSVMNEPTPFHRYVTQAIVTIPL